MKKLAYIIAVLVAVSGCNRVATPYKSSSIYGSWYTKSYKNINSHIVAHITTKEQFYRNGTLLSSKWFNFKNKAGNNLGEYYITKQFTFSKNNNTIKAKFIRCSTGITKPLKVNNLGYQKLYRACKTQMGSYKVTQKRYKVYGSQLMLNNKKYIRE